MRIQALTPGHPPCHRPTIQAEVQHEVFVRDTHGPGQAVHPYRRDAAAYPVDPFHRRRTRHVEAKSLHQFLALLVPIIVFSVEPMGHTVAHRVTGIVRIRTKNERQALAASGRKISVMASCSGYIGKEGHPEGIFPRIGEYDRWAIEWGYRWYPQFKTAKDEAPFLNKQIIDSLAKNKHLYFGNEMSFTDPRNQSEDLGDDAVLAGKYGIKNLQRILPQLKTWTREPNEGYTNLKVMYEELLKQYRLYTVQVMKSIAGSYVTAKSVEQPGNIFEPVEYRRQKDAMKFLNDYVFTTPAWLINDELTALTGTDPGLHISVARFNILMKLQGSGTLLTLLKATEQNKGMKTYKAEEFPEDLKRGVWSELYTGKPVDIYRRGLQKLYIDNAFKAFKPVNEIVGRNNGNGTIFYINPDPTANDVSSIMRAHLVSLRSSYPQSGGGANGFIEVPLAGYGTKDQQELEGKNR